MNTVSAKVLKARADEAQAFKEGLMNGSDGWSIIQSNLDEFDGEFDSRDLNLMLYGSDSESVKVNDLASAMYDCLTAQEEADQIALLFRKLRKVANDDLPNAMKAAQSKCVGRIGKKPQGVNERQYDLCCELVESWKRFRFLQDKIAFAIKSNVGKAAIVNDDQADEVNNKEGENAV